MAGYVKHNFEDGQVLHAQALNEMDDAIGEAKNDLDALSTELSSLGLKRITRTIASGGVLYCDSPLLPMRYILYINGSQTTAMSIVIGTGYGGTAARHKFVTLVEGSFSIVAREEVYGLMIANNSNIQVEVNIFGF